ncbi:hypothetical protein HBI24_152470 [Parastagonospora nodorum]|nr:hypothetical protein HBI95_141330 [Parastagonospora nodorum]KAH4220835.1 hypothetical protein HBI06_166050 [Parastagonospora nodorum]KAH4237233.1 hypothetical protein HBI05_128470 [Parastagonospora nodorum]KAH5185385.1 hypothetical protein HBH76_126430 [Parastagonospora nodorum]KAH5204775.1 hypothetical protein HBH68_098170 [Parastagonospora nodorum]
MSDPLASNHYDSAGEAHSQSPLFKLPTEIRNEIYAHAFGKSTTRYRLTLGEIRLYMSHADYKDDIATCKTLHGFPSWLLTCKQIKTEAMDLFVRTLTFRTPSWRHNTTPSTMHNTMVHEHGGLRNIRSVQAALSGRLRSYSSIRSGTLRRARLRASLPFVQPLMLHAGCLELVWNLWTSAELFAQESDACAKHWDASWDTRFRRVLIRVKFPAERDAADGESREAVEVAVKCATRLVGDGGVLTVGKACAIPMIASLGERLLWARAVVVERKI